LYARSHNKRDLPGWRRAEQVKRHGRIDTWRGARTGTLTRTAHVGEQ
jgi:hypothetical protein